MKTSRQIKAIRFYVVGASLVVGGFLFFAFKRDIWAYMIEGNWRGSSDDIIAILSIGTAVFACALCGYVILRAVSRSKLNVPNSMVYFFSNQILSAFIAPLLMLASRAFFPDSFRGELQQGFFAAPVISFLLSLGLLVLFLISLFFFRIPHDKPKNW